MTMSYHSLEPPEGRLLIPLSDHAPAVDSTVTPRYCCLKFNHEVMTVEILCKQEKAYKRIGLSLDFIEVFPMKKMPLIRPIGPAGKTLSAMRRKVDRYKQRASLKIHPQWSHQTQPLWAEQAATLHPWD